MAEHSYLRVVTEPACEPIHLDEAKLHLRVDGSGDDTLIPQLIRAAREWAEGYQGKAYVVRTYEMAFDDSIPEIITLPNPPLVKVSSITYLDSAGTATTVTGTDYTVDTHASPPRIFTAYSKSWPSVGRAIENTVKVTYIAGYAAKFTAAASDTCTVQGRVFVDNDVVRVFSSGGSDKALPTGLSAQTDYHVISVVGSTFELSLTEGGAAVDITGVGTGTHFIGEAPEFPQKFIAAMKLLIGHWYEHREEITELGRGATLATVPMAAKALLMQDRVSW